MFSNTRLLAEIATCFLSRVSPRQASSEPEERVPETIRCPSDGKIPPQFRAHEVLRMN